MPVEGFSRPCRMLGSISGLYPLDANSNTPLTPPTPSGDHQKCFQTLLTIFWEVKPAPVENHCSSRITYHFNKSSSIHSVYSCDGKAGCTGGCIFVDGSFHGQIRLKWTRSIASPQECDSHSCELQDG